MVSPYADSIKAPRGQSVPAGIRRRSAQRSSRERADPDLLDLPSKNRFRRAGTPHRRRISSAPPDTATLNHASAQELWDRFNFIRVNHDLPSPSTPATSIIYGTTATTSVISLVTTQGSASRMDVELARLGRLRNLTRLPGTALSFAVGGPDGRALHGLGIEAIKALVGRLR